VLLAATERGQGLVEYALIIVLIAVVVLAILIILGPMIGNLFTKVNSGVNGTY
jgi:pilus assembly protein Flp/PilA